MRLHELSEGYRLAAVPLRKKLRLLRLELKLADEPADSVFCQHGAGITVAWYKVPEWAHCPAVPADNC